MLNEGLTDSQEVFIALADEAAELEGAVGLQFDPVDSAIGEPYEGVHEGVVQPDAVGLGFAGQNEFDLQ
jgi:hypothetical protein